MIIDFHTHIFPEKIASSAIAELEQKSGLVAATKGNVEDLLNSMDNAGVHLSVIVPVVTSPKQFETVNSFAQVINEKYQSRFISFGGIHPNTEDYKEQLKTLKSMGFAGIKLHPDYQGVDFDDIRYKRIISYASELDMVIITHAGIDIGIPGHVRCTPAMSVNVIKETQAQKLVLAHLGGWKMWDEVEELLVGSDAFLDTAFIQDYISKEQFCRIVNNHGSDKILFATDSPWTDQKKAVSWLNDCNLSKDVKEAVFFQNAIRLLEL